MIGVIVQTDHGMLFQPQGRIGEREARFLSGYREAADMVGLGVQLVPVIITGCWPFPRTGRPEQEKRCLVGLEDGSGNDRLHHSVLACHPLCSGEGEDVVVAFIPASSLHQSSVAEALDTGRLAACFDLAAWFVDGLPGRSSTGFYALDKWEVRAFSLGVWANILVTRLYGMDILSHRLLQRMRLAICGIVMRKLALMKAAGTHGGAGRGASPMPPARAVEGYMRQYPGMMGRLADTLACCPEFGAPQFSGCPEDRCRAILARSLRFFQRDGERPG